MSFSPALTQHANRDLVQFYATRKYFLFFFVLVFTEWTDWSECSQTCGKSGIQTSMRECMQPSMEECIRLTSIDNPNYMEEDIALTREQECPQEFCPSKALLPQYIK